MSRFSREGEIVRVVLSSSEQELLGLTLAELRDMLIADQDEVLWRLKPQAHLSCKETADAFRELTSDDLLRSRLNSIELVLSTLSGAELDEADTAAWMQSLNSLRLVLGERLTSEGIDLTQEKLPKSSKVTLYCWIGWILDELISAANELLD